MQGSNGMSMRNEIHVQVYLIGHIREPYEYALGMSKGLRSCDPFLEYIFKNTIARQVIIFTIKFTPLPVTFVTRTETLTYYCHSFPPNLTPMFHLTG